MGAGAPNELWFPLPTDSVTTLPLETSFAASAPPLHSPFSALGGEYKGDAMDAVFMSNLEPFISPTLNDAVDRKVMSFSLAILSICCCALAEALRPPLVLLAADIFSDMLGAETASGASSEEGGGFLDGPGGVLGLV